MTAATMDELSNGRFCLGLGASTATIVTGWMGLAYPIPTTNLGEVASVSRAALSGERVRFAGQSVNVPSFRLQMKAPESSSDARRARPSTYATGRVNCGRRGAGDGGS